MRVKIVGAGPTGSLLALALSRAGSKVSIYDSNDRIELLCRSRAYALTHSSRRFLEEIELWDILYKILVPFSKLVVEDREISKRFIFRNTDLSSANQTYGSIGWIINHEDMMNIIIDRIIKDPNIDTFLGKETTSALEENDLLIAADGSNSKLRKLWNINTFSSLYKQACITAKISIRGASDAVSYEIFRKEGPLAILPMGEGVFQVVLTDNCDACKKLINLKPSRFLDRLAAVLPDDFQPDQLIDTPVSFPLKFLLASSLGHGKTLLVGESAHCFHPVGGQGMNICWRDISTLKRIIESVNNGRVKASNVHHIYKRNRYIDIITMSLFTDFILRFYSNRNSLLLPIRNFLIPSIMKSSIFRKLVLRIMTDGLFDLSA